MSHVVTVEPGRTFHRIARVRLRQRRVTVGRSLGNTLTLPDPRISRRHCELRLAERPPRILDRGSTHGLLVNGRPVRKADLRHGDVIELGSFRLTYCAADDGSEGAGDTDAGCPYLEIECRAPGDRRSEDDGPEECDRVLGEALKQIEILKRRLLDASGRTRDAAAWSEDIQESADRPSPGVRNRTLAAALDPPLPVELIFELDGDPPRSMVDVDLGKWFVGLLLVILAVALLWLFL